jgi:ABC-type nitrate/sulfonate/bicarbonate transport system substrate-binding protein
VKRVLPFEPEIHHVTVGHMPLLDAAPLLWAEHRGHFRSVGLDVTLVREVSWASLRDRLAYGALDAAQCLAPMAVAATLGADHVGVPLLTGLCLSQGGSAITISRGIAERLRITADTGVVDSARAVGDFLRHGGQLRLAHVFPFSMHHYMLREWLALGGVDELTPGLELSAAPPPRMVRLLESGAVDGFCVGEPWNTAAVRGGLGIVVTPTSAIWDGGADKVLGVTREWAQRFPQTHRALIAAVMMALKELSAREIAAELTDLLLQRQVLSVPGSWIEAALRGESAGSPPRFAAGLQAFPRRSQLMWCALQMLRWRQWARPLDLSALTSAVCDVSAFCDAASALQLPRPAVDAIREGGGVVALGVDGDTVETRFVDGAELDPDDPAGYLAARGWEIAAARSVLAG